MTNQAVSSFNLAGKDGTLIWTICKSSTVISGTNASHDSRFVKGGERLFPSLTLTFSEHSTLVLIRPMVKLTMIPTSSSPSWQITRRMSNGETTQGSHGAEEETEADNSIKGRPRPTIPDDSPTFDILCRRTLRFTLLLQHCHEGGLFSCSFLTVSFAAN